MKPMTKAEFLAKIEKELPDDAQIYGYSTDAGEFFDPEEAGDVFVPAKEYFDDADEDLDEFVPDETTHLWMVS